MPSAVHKLQPEQTISLTIRTQSHTNISGYLCMYKKQALLCCHPHTLSNGHNNSVHPSAEISTKQQVVFIHEWKLY